MNNTKRLIVTNHANNSIQWVAELSQYGLTSDNTYIYERSIGDLTHIEHLGKVIRSPNVGSNIYDYGRYIVENYDDLADINIFLKGNITWRTYTTPERLHYALSANWFVPIDTDPIGNGLPNYYEIMGSGLYVNDESFIESLDSISMNDHNSKIYPRIKGIREFIADLFIIKRFPQYLSYCPGVNMVVPKANILKYSKNFYKKMMFYTDYNNNPLEAHYFERILLMAWQGCLLENHSYQVHKNYTGVPVNK